MLFCNVSWPLHITGWSLVLSPCMWAALWPLPPIEWGENDSRWLLRLDHMATQLPCCSLGTLLSAPPNCHAVRGHVERPCMGAAVGSPSWAQSQLCKLRSSRWFQHPALRVTSPCLSLPNYPRKLWNWGKHPAILLTLRFVSIIKWLLFYATQFWSGLLCSHV